MSIVLVVFVSRVLALSSPLCAAILAPVFFSVVEALRPSHIFFHLLVSELRFLFSFPLPSLVHTVFFLPPHSLYQQKQRLAALGSKKLRPPWGDDRQGRIMVSTWHGSSVITKGGPDQTPSNEMKGGRGVVGVGGCGRS
jgi:hypothetical protein